MYVKLWIWFPVWRELKHNQKAFSPQPPWSLWIWFPVWRELKRYFRRIFVAHTFTLDMVSRLKGIETFSLSVATNTTEIPLDMVSRLKGIETGTPYPVRHQHWSFGYGFPFEGNWNNTGNPRRVFGTLLWIWFPVWRELKQILLWKLHNRKLLWIWFPVWRELKHRHYSITPPKACRDFGYGFPFEGNWNTMSPRWKLWDVIALDMVSRLKGIETAGFWVFVEMRLQPLDMVSRLKGIETWSHALPWHLQSLWIWFPVWRELKPDRRLFQNQSFVSLWIWFPVWRELKH